MSPERDLHITVVKKVHPRLGLFVTRHADSSFQHERPVGGYFNSFCSRSRLERPIRSFMMSLWNSFLLFWSLVSTATHTTTALNISAVDLPFGDINVLVLTDTHSWVTGHKQESPLNADYGNVLSFYEHIQHVPNLFFCVNGDWIDGTGLSMNGEAFSLTQILERMPWDALNIGNHELYHPQVIDFIQQPGGFVDWWQGRYLTSNVVRADNQEPIGSRYRVLRGESTTVLTFGFLYNMMDHVDSVNVEQVESVVNSTWFYQALTADQYDGILVLAHMHVEDPLVNVILIKIRLLLGNDMPVQFLTGHTHIRSFVTMDEASTSFEAGRYLDTLGFVSFPKQATLQAAVSNENLFQHKFIDANQETFRQILGINKLDTPNGKELSDFILTVQENMGLNEHIGCVEQSYFVENGVDEEQSLWGFFNERVVATQFEEDNALLLDKGGWRYDLVGGQLRVGDIIAVSPFNDSLHAWEDVSGAVIIALNETVNNGTETWMPKLPAYVLGSAKPLDASKRYNLITGGYDVERMRSVLQEIDSDTASRDPNRLDVTSTSIWLQFFQDHSPCASPVHDTPSKFHFPWQSTAREDEAEGSTKPRNNDDLFMLFFMFASVVIVALLGINVYQRGQLLRRQSAQRDATIMQALQEYSDSHEADDEFVITDSDEDDQDPAGKLEARLV